MTKEQIAATVERFASTASLAERAGFDGVEVHGAHGYLISQFLSPLVNRRSDEWGGSLENRARLLLDVVRAIREAVSPSFAVAVKLNSAISVPTGVRFAAIAPGSVPGTNRRVHPIDIRS